MRVIWVLPMIMALYIVNTAAIAESPTPERVLWNKTPITVALNLNQERMIHFPTAIRYWLPDFLIGKASLLAANGVLYITAHQNFEKTRIRIQSLENQRIYLLDLVAGESHQVGSGLVITDKDTVISQSSPAETRLKKSDWYVRLTRFAAQTLYADEHLLPSDREISRIKVNRSLIIPLIRGGDIEASLIDAWRGGGLYITAVRIKNLSKEVILIVNKKNAVETNERRIIALSTDLRGDWLAATAQHHHLAAYGGREDRTTVYLISTRPFMESL